MQQDRMVAAARMFGERLREVRQAAGLTLVQMCERTGISAGYISSVEGGIANVTLDTMILLADAVGAEVWDLVRSPPDAG